MAEPSRIETFCIDQCGLTSFRGFGKGSMIPEEKNAAVARALHEAFGVTKFTDIRRTTKGLSSDLVFRIVVLGAPYVLRIMTRIDERMDPDRIFACMSAAAEAGLAPRVRYSNAEDGISITDFVEAVPFPATQALVQLPGTLRRLHALPPFPKAFNYVTAHNGFIWRFRKASLLPKGEIEEVFTGYEQLCATYPRLDSDMVSCHMDLKPENILFDGQHVWLTDWQAAFVNDRYFDLAVAANFLLTSDADEPTYLERYFGQRPNEYQRARLFLMRQVVHMFYATVFLMLGSAGKPIDQSGKLSSFRDFHLRIWAGEVNLADNDLKVVYGRVHWEQLLQNMWQAQFEEALRIVADQSSGPEVMRQLLPFQQ
jgi:thiamine kinase-like enzyme